MSTPTSIQTAQSTLASFAGIQPPPLTTPAEQDQVKAALLALAEVADYQMFGILAETCEQAITTLQAYTQSFGYDMPTSWQPVEGPTYLKFNPNLGSCYTDSYTGEHRGVLISYQSAVDETMNQTYGHFPLDLFLA